MPAGIAEDLVENPARSIDHRGLLVETRRRSDIPGHRQDALDAVERPERFFEHGESVERAHLRGLRALGDID